MAKTQIRLSSDADLQREEAFYTGRSDRDARLILALLKELRWYRGMMTGAVVWTDYIENARQALSSDGAA